MRLRLVEGLDALPPSPGNREVDTERWDLVPAQYGSGDLLLAIGGQRVRVWAPPGVALTGELDEYLERWTHAEVALAQTSIDPNAVQVVALAQVVEAIPPDFEPWAIDATLAQIRILGLYLSSAAEDEFAATAREVRRELTEAVAAHSPARPARLDGEAIPVDRPFTALSDHDFRGLVCEMLTAYLAHVVEPLHRPLSSCVDILVTESAGARHLIQIEHHVELTASDLATRVQYHAQCLQPGEFDVHWLFTSHQLDLRLRRELGQAISPWGAERQCVVGAEELEQMLDQHPDVWRRQIKLRVARAAQLGKVPNPPALRSWAQTDALANARRRLEETGAVFILGDRGTGKSSLLQMLVADAALDDYRPCPAVNTGIHATDDPRIVYWDDATDLQRLTPLVEAARRGELRLIVTCEAEFACAFAEHAVEIAPYGPNDRAAVYYNQVSQAAHLHPEARAALAEPQAYLAVMHHPGFTPRLASEVVAEGPRALDRLPRATSQGDEWLEAMFGRVREQAIVGHGNETHRKLNERCAYCARHTH